MIPMMCTVSAANVMKEPGHKQELHTQLLFGDTVLELERQGAWSRIRIDWDQYEGWVLSGQLGPASDQELAAEPVAILRSGWRLGDEKAGIRELFPATRCGAKILTQAESGKAIPEQLLLPLAPKTISEELVRDLLSVYLYAPYMWGGNTPAGIDCSGLSQMLYRFFAIRLPHYASEQMEFGMTLDFLQQARAGDLAFFASESGEIQHVGVLLSADEIMHASESNGKVDIDTIDSGGILNRRTGRRTHGLRVVKRLLDY